MPLAFQHLVLVLVVVGAVSVINRLRPSPPLNGWRVGFLVVLGLLVVGVILAVAQGPDAASYAIGSQVGGALWALLLTAFMSRRFERRCTESATSAQVPAERESA